MKRLIFYIFFTLALLSQAFTQSDKRSSDWISYAKQYIGTPYLYGGMSKNGIDCSGFIHITAFESIQLSLPRTTEALYSWVKIIPDNQKKAGDLVFFKTTGSAISHVGLYMGNNQFIHAASSGPNTGVIVSSLTESYWKDAYAGIGRVLDENSEENTQNLSNRNLKEINNRNGFSNINATQTTPTVNKIKSLSRTESSFGFLYNDYIQFELGISIDWSFYNIPGIFLSTRGITLHSFMQTKKFPNNFGLGADFNYDDFLSVIHVPIYLSLEINPQLKIYTGPVFSIGTAKIIEDTAELEVKAPIYPLFMGISFETPIYDFFGMKAYLFQKLNYTYYKSVTNDELSVYNAYRSSLVFKSGLQILL